ncbi:MAG: DUF4340 domain-containing protein [Planctomycetota bacterium]|nr:MAG: DUF4340 domain-containing protein [Planctomycetota bacterium]
MSTRALVILLVVVAALAALAAALTLSGPGGAAPAGPAPLLDFAPSDADAIEIDRPGSPTLRLQRAEGGWTLRAPDTGGGERMWPLQGAQVRGLLAVLARAAPAADADPSAIGPPALSLTLELTDGRTRTLELGADAVGGRRPARTDAGRTVYLEAPIFEALTQPGPMGWRDTRVFRAVGADTARLRVAWPDGPALEIARLGDRWSVRAPARAPADSGAVERALSSLAALRVARWLDADPPEGAFAHAVAITAQRDVRRVDRDGRPRVDSASETLLVGAEADVDGLTRFVRLGDTGAVGIAELADLAPALAPAEAFVSRTPAPIDASRVAEIRIGAARTLTRALEGWRDAATGADADADADAVLALLVRTPADRVTIGERRGEAGATASVVLIGFDGGPIAEFEIARAGGGAEVRAGGVTWRYAETPGPLPF